MNNPLNLYEHNRKSYEKIKNAFDRLRADLGDDFIYIIGNHLSLLDQILESQGSCN